MSVYPRPDSVKQFANQCCRCCQLLPCSESSIWAVRANSVRVTGNSDVTRLGKGCRQYFRNEGEGRLQVKSRLPSCKILLKSNSACAAECDAPIPPMSSQSELVGRISVARPGPDCCRRVPGCRLENSEPRKPRPRFRCLG